MSTTIPQFYVGRNVTVASCKNYASISSSAVLSGGSAFDVHTLGVLDEITFRAELGGIEISGADYTIENYMQGKVSFTVSFNEIISGNLYSNIQNAWMNALNGATSPYFKFSWAAAGAGQTANYMIVVATLAGGDCEFAGAVEGKQVCKATFRPCGLMPYFGPLSGDPFT